MPVGWRTITFASVAMIMTIYGQTAGVSVFVNPLIDELGVRRTEISIVYSAASLLAAATIPWIGQWIDRVGVRRATIVIATVFGLVVANFLPQTLASVAAVAAVGVLSDRTPPRRLLLAAMGLVIGGVVLMPVLAVPFMPIAYAAAPGAGLGSTQALEGALYVRYFGVHSIGAIRGAAFAVTVAAAALGPVLVGLAHELRGGYQAAMAMPVLPAAVSVGAAVVGVPKGARC